MKKWKLYVIVLLCFGLVGCANKQVGDNNGNTKLQTEGNISEQIENHLYVEAEFHLPTEELSTYSTELKKFDYDKIQAIFWPDANTNEITTNEFGERCYKKATIGSENGSLMYRANDDIDYLEYPFVIEDIPVFGPDDPVVQYTGDDSLLAQNMGAKMIISNAGIEELQLEGVLNKWTKSGKKAEIIGYEGIRQALDKKFGNVILTDEYKVSNIWMEYFPLIQSDSFNQVEVIPVWCCDFKINGKDENYTLRFHAITGEELS